MYVCFVNDLFFMLLYFCLFGLFMFTINFLLQRFIQFSSHAITNNWSGQNVCNNNGRNFFKIKFTHNGHYKNIRQIRYRHFYSILYLLELLRMLLAMPIFSKWLVFIFLTLDAMENDLFRRYAGQKYNRLNFSENL